MTDYTKPRKPRYGWHGQEHGQAEHTPRTTPREGLTLAFPQETDYNWSTVDDASEWWKELERTFNQGKDHHNDVAWWWHGLQAERILRECGWIQ